MSKKLTREDFIQKAKQVHCDKYDYSKVDYINIRTKICIICPKHGDFWQTPFLHIHGANCPLCNSSHLEEEIMLLLKQKNILYEPQKSIEWLKNPKTNKLLKLDFYLPQYNVAIECQGIQHFKSGHWEGLENITERDNIKRQLCEEHGIKLLYYSNLGIDYPYKVFENKEELINSIC